MVIQFSSLLNSTLNSGAAHLASAKDNGKPADPTRWGWRPGTYSEYQPMGSRIGWIEDQDIYLDGGAAFSAVQKLAASQGTSLPVTQTVLWKRLAEKGFLASTERGRNAVRRTLNGKREWVIHLNKDKLDGANASQTTTADDGLDQESWSSFPFWPKDLDRELEAPEEMVH